MTPFFPSLFRALTMGLVVRRSHMAKAISIVPIVIKAVANLVPFASVVAAGVAEDMADGSFTVEEAEARAAELVAGSDIDLKVKFKKVDIVDDETEQLLARAIVRIVAAAARAIKG